MKDPVGKCRVSLWIDQKSTTSSPALQILGTCVAQPCPIPTDPLKAEVTVTQKRDKYSTQGFGSWLPLTRKGDH